MAEWRLGGRAGEACRSDLLRPRRGRGGDGAGATLLCCIQARRTRVRDIGQYEPPPCAYPSQGTARGPPRSVEEPGPLLPNCLLPERPWGNGRPHCRWSPFQGGSRNNKEYPELLAAKGCYSGPRLPQSPRAAGGSRRGTADELSHWHGDAEQPPSNCHAPSTGGGTHRLPCKCGKHQASPHRSRWVAACMLQMPCSPRRSARKLNLSF